MKFTNSIFKEIPHSTDWISVEKITKGWSSDSKYLIQTTNGEWLMLRISDISQLDAKKKEYCIISKYATLGFSMSQLVDFGICNGGKNVYILLTWVEGRDLEEVLPNLSETEQYLLGREAGTILKKIHSLSVAAEDVPQSTRIAKKAVAVVML